MRTGKRWWNNTPWQLLRVLPNALACVDCVPYTYWMGHGLLILAASHLHRLDVPGGFSTDAHL